MNTKKYKNDQIRELLDKNLPQAPQNEWFIRKTINRLPEKHSSSVSTIEIVAYLIAILAIISIESCIIYNVLTRGTFTLNDLVWIMALNIGLLTIIFAIFTPQFRNYFY